MPWHAMRLGCLLLAALLLAAPLAAEEIRSLAREPAEGPLSAEEIELCRVEAWKSIQSLHSGYFRFTGEIESPANGTIIIKGQQAFDYDKQRLRFDYVASGMSFEREQLQFISRADWSASYARKPRSFIGRHPPGLKAGISLRPFDPRILGVTDYEAQRRDGWPNWVRDALQDKAPSKAERMANGLFRLVWHWSDEFGSDSRQTVWFNPKQGFAPVRRESWASTLDGTRALRCVIETSYVHRDDCWLPAHWRANNRRDPDAPLLIDMELDWLSCNKADFQRLYEVEGFGAPAGTAVINFFAKPPVEEFKIEVAR